MEIKDKYNLWLENVKDNELLNELKEMSEKEIEDAFYKDLSWILS